MREESILQRLTVVAVAGCILHRNCSGSRRTGKRWTSGACECPSCCLRGLSVGGRKRRLTLSVCCRGIVLYSLLYARLPYDDGTRRNRSLTQLHAMMLDHEYVSFSLLMPRTPLPPELSSCLAPSHPEILAADLSWIRLLEPEGDGALQRQTVRNRCARTIDFAYL